MSSRFGLASCLTPSCELTARPLWYNVTLRGEADLGDTLIKLCRAGEESQGHVSMSFCVCEGGGQRESWREYTLFQLQHDQLRF